MWSWTYVWLTLTAVIKFICAWCCHFLVYVHTCPTCKTSYKLNTILGLVRSLILFASSIVDPYTFDASMNDVIWFNCSRGPTK